MKKFLFLLVCLWGLGIVNSYAQCPMCRTAVESGMDKEHGKGKGLNKGILYLLATPYLAVGIVGGIWYHKNKRK
jgi:hypothetical protein